MNKYIITLILAAVGGTAMAQLQFQPKHPGITARQLQQGQEEATLDQLVQKLGNRNNQPAKTQAIEDEEVLQLDSIVVTQAGVLLRARYLEYHPNGNMAKQLSKQVDADGNWVEMDHIEWTEDYPLKDSYMIEYGYDEEGVYGGTYKKVWNDDDTYSFTEYKGVNGKWKPTHRVSSTMNEQYQTVSEAYYIYDEMGNEVPEDSVAYAYNEEGRLVCETYFFGEENGQLVEIGSFFTSYDNVDTPSGPGELVTYWMSDMGFKRETVTSNDQNYEHVVEYIKEDMDSDEWEKHREQIQQNYGDTLMVDVSFKYEDNAVWTGKKTVVKTLIDNESTRKYKAFEYTCATDSAQWTLIRRIEDYYAYDANGFGREDLNHQTYYTMADENGEVRQGYDIFIWDFQHWTAPYTLKKEEYYDGEQEYGVTKIYYYHDPNSTAITDIQAQPNEGMQFDLYGRRLSQGQRGAFMIKDGRVVLIQNQ